MRSERGRRPRGSWPRPRPPPCPPGPPTWGPGGRAGSRTLDAGQPRLGAAGGPSAPRPVPTETEAPGQQARRHPRRGRGRAAPGHAVQKPRGCSPPPPSASFLCPSLGTRLWAVHPDPQASPGPPLGTALHPTFPGPAQEAGRSAGSVPHSLPGPPRPSSSCSSREGGTQRARRPGTREGGAGVGAAALGAGGSPPSPSRVGPGPLLMMESGTQGVRGGGAEEPGQAGVCRPSRIRLRLNALRAAGQAPLLAGSQPPHLRAGARAGGAGQGRSWGEPPWTRPRDHSAARAQRGGRPRACGRESGPDPSPAPGPRVTAGPRPPSLHKARRPRDRAPRLPPGGRGRTRRPSPKPGARGAEPPPAGPAPPGHRHPPRPRAPSLGDPAGATCWLHGVPGPHRGRRGCPRAHGGGGGGPEAGPSGRLIGCPPWSRSDTSRGKGSPNPQPPGLQARGGDGEVGLIVLCVWGPPMRKRGEGPVLGSRGCVWALVQGRGWGGAQPLCAQSCQADLRLCGRWGCREMRGSPVLGGRPVQCQPSPPPPPLEQDKGAPPGRRLALSGCVRGGEPADPGLPAPPGAGAAAGQGAGRAESGSPGRPLGGPSRVPLSGPRRPWAGPRARGPHGPVQTGIWLPSPLCPESPFRVQDVLGGLQPRQLDAVREPRSYYLGESPPKAKGISPRWPGLLQST